MEPTDQGVSQGQAAPAQSAQSDSSQATTTSTETTQTQGQQQQGTQQQAKTGYDAIPDYGKEIIRRNAEKARQAEETNKQLLQQMQELQKSMSMDEDTKKNIAALKTLAPQAGLVPKDEVSNLVQQQVNQAMQQLRNEQQKQADKADLEAVLKEFDGTTMPKIDPQEIANFLQTAQNDPRQQHWLGASFREIASHLKQSEIVKMEVDKLISQGTNIPPKVEKGGTGNSVVPPAKKVPRLNKMSDVNALIKAKLGA